MVRKFYKKKRFTGVRRRRPTFSMRRTWFRGNTRMGMARTNGLRYLATTAMPDHYMCKLQYANQETKTITDAAFAKIDLRANNLYDPEAAVGGGQPRYFDQLAAMYKYYCVTGCKLEVRACPDLVVTGAASNIMVAILPTSDSSYSPASMKEIYENKEASVYWRNNYDGNKIIKRYVSTNKIWGVNRTTVKQDDVFRSLCTGAPSKEWRWFIYTNVCDESNATLDTTIVVWYRLTYYVTFSDLVDVARS